MILYGIPNCNTIKKTINWLHDHKIPFRFHNYKKEGISLAKLKEWNKEVGWPAFFNKSSSTWKLQKKDITALTAARALAIMKENPSIIKRPILEYKGKLIVGYDEALYNKIFLTTKKETK